MKNIINSLNSENHSRIAKGLKKSFKSMGINVSQSQANEAVANTFGFPNLHSAKKYYDNKNQCNLKNYIISYDYEIFNDGEIVLNNCRKTHLFLNQNIVRFNVYALSKVVNFYDLNLNTESNKKFKEFLDLTSKYVADNLLDDYLDLDVSHIFAHSDESDFDFDYIFSHKESVEKFDEVFKNNIENSGFRTYDDFNKIAHQYINIKWTEINQEQVNFMMENNIGNC